ncbi:MAG: class I SAM-dependent methyltransferase [Chthoniobacterales bacterium]
MNYQLEVRIPISPTPDFLRRIHFMAGSLERLKDFIGPYLLVVCVGADVEAYDLYERERWSREYPIIWLWADREKYRRDSFWETSREIFRQPTRGRVVMCADADVLFVSDFCDLIGDLVKEPAVAGVIAHSPPFQNEKFANTWRDLCAKYGTPPPSFDYEHTGWGFMVQWEILRFTPPYFNFGMVAAPAELMEVISMEIGKADDFVNAQLDTFFRFQIALTLSILKHRLPVRSLPLRYNFPNDPDFDAKYPEELADVRILHYLRCETVHRERDFRTLTDVAALTARRDLTGSNEVFRQRIENLYPIVAEQERTSGTMRPVSRLESIVVPDNLQRNGPDVLAEGIEETGESLLNEVARRIGRSDLASLDLLDVGCGVRFTQTLINRTLPFASYTGIEVFRPIVDWLKERVENHDDRFRFIHWDVRNSMYNPKAPSMGDYGRLPVDGSYDVIMGFSLFTHLEPEDAANMLQFMRKVVRRGGFLFFSAFCDDLVERFEDRIPEQPLLNAYYNRKYLERLVTEAGWQIASYAGPAGYLMHSFLCKPVDRGQ